MLFLYADMAAYQLQEAETMATKKKKGSELTYLTSVHQVCDAETGELISKNVKTFSPELKRRQESKELSRWAQHEPQAKDKRHFFNVKMEKWKEFSELDNFLTGYALFLGTFMKNDGCLYKNEKSQYPVDPEELHTLLRKHERTGKTVLHGLISNNLATIVTVAVNGRAYPALKMSDSVFYRGSHADNGKKKTAKVFNEVIQELYYKNNAKAVSFIAKLIPHLDRESNTLCFNPNRRSYEDILYMSRADIAEATGVSEKQVSTLIRSISYGDYKALASWNVGNKKSTVMNPEISTRQRGIAAKELMDRFRIKKR